MAEGNSAEVEAKLALDEILEHAKHKALQKNRSVMKDKVKINKAREIKEIHEEKEKIAKLISIVEKSKVQRKVLENSLKSIDGQGGILHSRMHNLPTNNWLRARHAAKVSSAYYYFPDETKKRQQMMAIFQNFDEDGNGQLEIDEFLDMFINTFVFSWPEDTEYSGPPDPLSLDEQGRVVTEDDPEKKIRFKRPKDIDEKDRLTQEQLDTIREFLDQHFRSFYTFVTKKHYLSKSEFINLALDKDANDFFLQIMRELTNMIKEMGKRTEMEIPYSFEKMIGYLGYCTQRDFQYGMFKQQCKTNFKEASKHLEQLLFLKSEEIKDANQGRTKLDHYRLKFKGKVAGGVDLADIGCLLVEAEKQVHHAEDLNIKKDGKKLMGTMFKSAFNIDPTKQSNLEEQTPVSAYAQKLRGFKDADMSLKETAQDFKFPFNLAGEFFTAKNDKEEVYIMPDIVKRKIDSQIKSSLINAQKSAVKESNEILSKYSSQRLVPEFELFRAKSNGNLSTQYRSTTSKMTRSVYGEQPTSHSTSRANLFKTGKQSFKITNHKGSKSEIPADVYRLENFETGQQNLGYSTLGNPVFNWRQYTANNKRHTNHLAKSSTSGIIHLHEKIKSLAKISEVSTVADQQTNFNAYRLL